MSRPVVYYDGLCGLCDGFVRFVVARDRLSRYRFAPLQGETARANLSPELTGETLRTVILDDNHAIRVKSDAALAILEGLEHGWGMVRVFRIVPRPIRDAIYGFIARHRFRWFGRLEACRAPTREERDRFLP